MEKKCNKKPIPVMVAIPNQGSICTYLAKQLIDMVCQGLLTGKYNVDLIFSKVTCIDYNRNTIVKRFLESKNKWLLMIDNDNPCLKNPLDLIDKNKDIIVYPTFMLKTTDAGEPTLNYNVFLKEKKLWRSQRMTQGKKFQQYDAGGTGCMLIKRKVLEEISAPFLSKVNKDGVRDVGMDLWFCERAKKKGFEVWAHWDYACQHFKEVDLIDVARMLLRDKYNVSPLKKIKEKK